jgi:hypothetical protein
MNSSCNFYVRRFFLFVCLLAVLPPAALLAQASGRGTIQGTVSDATGAVIPGATVKAVEVSTNFERDQTTTGSGFYAIASIDPGVYRITVTAPGFKGLHPGQHHR